MDRPGSTQRPGEAGGARGEHDELQSAIEATRFHLEVISAHLEGHPPPGPNAEIRHHHPAWRLPSEGEERWQVALAIAVVITLQFWLPDRLSLGPRLLLPSLAAALGIGLLIANPRKINRRSRVLRTASVVLIALTSLVNAWSSYELVKELVKGTAGSSAGPLLATGASIYLTNIVVFSLWYWEWDRGGPVARAHGERLFPDLLFPQMVSPEMAPPSWRPTYLDYLYVSYTNATAFSPTDTMPMSRWTKLLFLCQSAIALVVAALVVARAVNIFR